MHFPVLDLRHCSDFQPLFRLAPIRAERFGSGNGVGGLAGGGLAYDVDRS
jgi:hypothetical protein